MTIYVQRASPQSMDKLKSVLLPFYFCQKDCNKKQKNFWM